MYLAADVSVLSNEEFTNLFNIYKTSPLQQEKDAARNEIITRNIKFITRIAQKYRGKGLSEADLIQEGVFGIIKALDKFEPAKGAWTTYCSNWIKEKMRKALVMQTRNIKIPLLAFKRLCKYKKTEETLRDKLGREATYSEVLNEMGITSKQDYIYHNIRAADNKIGSLNNTDSEDNERFEENLIDRKSAEPISVTVNKEDMLRLEEAIDKLDERSKKIILLRREGETLDDIGQKFGLSRQRIQQIEEAAIKQLQKVA